MRAKAILLVAALGLAAVGCGEADAHRGFTQEPIQFVIDSGNTESRAQDLRDHCLVGLQFGTLTGASVTAKTSHDRDSTAANWVTIRDSNDSDWSLTVTDDRAYDLTQGGSALCGHRYVKLVSASSEGSRRTVYGFIGD